MNSKNSLLVVFISALFFVFLFYKQWLGINLVLFEATYLVYLFAYRKIEYSKTMLFTLVLLLGTLLATIINYSTISYWIHFLLLLVFVGFVNHAKLRSIWVAFAVGTQNVFANQVLFVDTLANLEFKGKKGGVFFSKYLIYSIPIVIILIFIGIYSASNPIFSDYTGEIFQGFWNAITYVFENINLSLVGVFLLGLFIANFLFLESSLSSLFKKDQKASENLLRTKTKKNRNFKILGLKTEYKVAVFLLFILNILILLLNLSDLIWVWFNFEWEGQSLKQFVHEGTYLLIFSIIISLMIVLYFFRKNINFLAKNKLLKILAYIWIFQNALLALSVLRRNLWYIDYFSLAYKRIGVFIFLIIIIYGLYSVFRKIRDQKTTYYLFKTNALCVMIVLSLTAIVNWDVTIAKYNFTHYETGFVHLDWLSNLSDKTIPYLKKDPALLQQIETIQNQLYPDPKLRQDYPYYSEKIENRTNAFLQKWERKSFLSWNYAEYKAYQKLVDKP